MTSIFAKAITTRVVEASKTLDMMRTNQRAPRVTPSRMPSVTPKVRDAENDFEDGARTARMITRALVSAMLDQDRA
jgi:hypothetical protein